MFKKRRLRRKKLNDLRRKLSNQKDVLDRKKMFLAGKENLGDLEIEIELDISKAIKKINKRLNKIGGPVRRRKPRKNISTEGFRREVVNKLRPKVKKNFLKSGRLNVNFADMTERTPKEKENFIKARLPEIKKSEGFKTLRPKLPKKSKISQYDTLKNFGFIKEKTSLASIDSILDYLEGMVKDAPSFQGSWVVKLKSGTYTFHNKVIHNNIEEAFDEIMDIIEQKYDDDVEDIIRVNFLFFDEESGKDYLERIIAYGTICDPVYQRKSLVSLSTKSRVCIYFSYLYIIGELRIPRGKSAESMDPFVMKQLSSETPEIRKLVKSGNIHKFLLAKSVDLDLYMYVDLEQLFYKYSKGIVYCIEREELPKDQMFFYHKDQHVVPSSLKKFKASGKRKLDPKKSYIIMNPWLDSCPSRNLQKQIHFYDIESYKDGKFGVLCDVTKNQSGKWEFRHFYNLDDFVDYIDSIAFKQLKKTKPNKKLIYHQFYAHNASNYDAIYIYRALNKRLRLKHFIGEGTSIKSFNYGTNIEFKDSVLLIQGSLEKLTRDVFKVTVDPSELPINYYNLKKRYDGGKEAYPYYFYSEENKNYIGDIPEPAYFGKAGQDPKYRLATYQRCVDMHKKHGINQFDMDKYTLYYCYLDCILGYKMIMKFKDLNSISVNNPITGTECDTLKRSVPINERNDIKLKEHLEKVRPRLTFNPLEYKTISSLTLAKFKKFYNKKLIYGIPKQYENCAISSYHGGITDVYKRRYVRPDIDEIYKNHETMSQEDFNKYMSSLKNEVHKEDINSSYPASMMGTIPYRFIGANYSESDLKQFRENFFNNVFSDTNDYIQSKMDSSEFSEKESQKTRLKLLNTYIVDTFLYEITYEYKDPKFIPNIYIFDGTKFRGAIKGHKEYVWGNMIKQAMREHILNRESHHGSSPMFKYLYISGFLRFQSEPIFKEYIQSIYEKRLKIKDKINRIEKYQEDVGEDLSVLKIKSKFLKDNMNCLYGKMSQKPFGRTHIVTVDEYKKIATTGDKYITNIKYLPETDKYPCSMLVSLKSLEGQKNNIGKCTYIASYIASRSREALMEMVYEAGAKNALYVDTDACYYMGPRIGKIDAGKLGYRDSEIEENELGNNVIVTEVYFNAPKFYGTKGFRINKKTNNWEPMKPILKSKGVQKGLVSFQDIKDLNLGTHDTKKVSTVQFKRKIIDSYVEVNQMDKLVKCVYSKRIFNRDTQSRCARLRFSSSSMEDLGSEMF